MFLFSIAARPLVKKYETRSFIIMLTNAYHWTHFLARWIHSTYPHTIQISSGTHLTSYPMGTKSSFPGGKAAGAWSWPLTSI